MKKIYKFKTDKKDTIKEIVKFKELADLVGVTPSYISCIVNGKKNNISKTLAYCMCKAVNSNYEITDLFDIVEE